MYTVFFHGVKGAICPHEAAVVAAKTRAQNVEEFPFGLIADRSVAAAHTDV